MGIGCCILWCCCDCCCCCCCSCACSCIDLSRFSSSHCRVSSPMSKVLSSREMVVLNSDPLSELKGEPSPPPPTDPPGLNGPPPPPLLMPLVEEDPTGLDPLLSTSPPPPNNPSSSPPPITMGDPPSNTRDIPSLSGYDVMPSCACAVVLVEVKTPGVVGVRDAEVTVVDVLRWGTAPFSQQSVTPCLEDAASTDAMSMNPGMEGSCVWPRCSSRSCHRFPTSSLKNTCKCIKYLMVMMQCLILFSYKYCKYWLLQFWV